MKNLARAFPLFCLLLITAAMESCGSSGNSEEAAAAISDTAQLLRRLDTIVAQMNKAVSREDRLTAIRYCEEGLALEIRLPEEKKTYGDLHSRFGELLWQAGLYDYAAEHFRKAIAGSEKKKPADHSGLYNKQARLAAFFVGMKKTDSAAFYYRKAIATAQKDPDPLWLASAYNNYAFQHEAAARLDSAGFYYTLAERSLRLKNKDDSSLLASIRDNQAHLLLQRKAYAEADEGYRRNEKLYHRLRSHSGQVKSLLNSAEVYTAAGKHLQALQLIDSVYNSFQDVFSSVAWQRLRYLNMHYRQLKTLDRTGEALAALQQLEHFKDSTAAQQKTRNASLLSVAASGELERRRRENEIRELRLQKAIAQSRLNWIMGLAIGFFSLLAIAFLILLFRKKSNEQTAMIRLAEADLRTKQLEGEKLQHELELKKRDLTDMVLLNRQKKEIMSDLLRDLQEVLQSEDSESALKRLVHELRARSQTTESLELIGENIESVNKAFFDKLEAQYPDLSKGERALCGMLRMNLSTKDIAQLRKITPESVKMAKKRLRRKLGLQPESDLYLCMQKM